MKMMKIMNTKNDANKHIYIYICVCVYVYI